MFDNVKQLLATFCGKASIDFRCDEENNTAEFNFNGLNVRLCLYQESGLLRFQTAVDMVPVKNREEALLALLEADNLLSGTHFYTLGLDDDASLVQLHIDWEADRLNDKAFSNLVHNLLTVAENTMMMLDDIRHRKVEKEEQTENRLNATGMGSSFNVRDIPGFLLRI